MTLAVRAAADLRWIAQYWEDLTESRLPGTPAPFRRPHLTREQCDDRDWQARQERWERTPEAIGVSPAPLRVPVLDLVTGLLADAVALADDLAHAVERPELPAPSSGLADARPYLAYAAACVLEVDARGATLEAWAYRQTRAMVATVAYALALVYDGQQLDVECPWCRGVTPETPAGGAHTWRVRDLLGWKTCGHGQPDRRFCTECEQQVVIVCEGVCEPPSKSVGTWWRGYPCWPIYEWDWLAVQVKRAA